MLWSVGQPNAIAVVFQGSKSYPLQILAAGLLVQGDIYPINQNLVPTVNLSYYMDLWTLRNKLQKKSCWTFSNDL